MFSILLVLLAWDLEAKVVDVSLFQGSHHVWDIEFI
jgi:hypothetical protein